MSCLLRKQSLGFKLGSQWASKTAPQERVNTHFSYTCLEVLNFPVEVVKESLWNMEDVNLNDGESPVIALKRKHSMRNWPRGKKKSSPPCRRLLLPHTLLLFRLTLLCRQEVENRVLLRLTNQESNTGRLWFLRIWVLTT